MALAQTPPPVAPPASAANPWEFNLTVDGYVIPQEQGYASPTFTADRTWLHLEARYNYENLRTGSLWFGRNFSIGKDLVFAITPMIGGVFGRTNGIAPGCEASLTYKKVELSVSNEYVFDTSSKSGNFYYAWPQLTYTPVDWLRVGLVAQHTKVFQTKLDIQRGFLVGFSHKRIEFTTYIFNAGFTDPTIVYEVGFSF
jgi:predicted porin